VHQVVGVLDLGALIALGDVLDDQGMDVETRTEPLERSV
jgi:hypothetical protein